MHLCLQIFGRVSEFDFSIIASFCEGIVMSLSLSIGGIACFQAACSVWMCVRLQIWLLLVYFEEFTCSLLMVFSILVESESSATVFPLFIFLFLACKLRQIHGEKNGEHRVRLRLLIFGRGTFWLAALILGTY